MICLSNEATLVRDELIKSGLETPMVNPSFLTSKQRKDGIESHFVEILKLLGLDLTDDSLVETPYRISKMYINELFSGLDYQSFPKITTIENKMQVDEMVKVSDVSLTSTCEHHFVIIDGFATVAYIPRTKVIGLSKINRIVQFFSQRPQVQERLTQQIRVALQVLLESNDVAVSINATHYCVKSRGIMDSSSFTTTKSLGGVFKSKPEIRAEFLSCKL